MLQNVKHLSLLLCKHPNRRLPLGRTPIDSWFADGQQLLMVSSKMKLQRSTMFLPLNVVRLEEKGA